MCAVPLISNKCGEKVCHTTKETGLNLILLGDLHTQDMEQK